MQSSFFRFLFSSILMVFHFFLLPFYFFNLWISISWCSFFLFFLMVFHFLLCPFFFFFMVFHFFLLPFFFSFYGFPFLIVPLFLFYGFPFPLVPLFLLFLWFSISYSFFSFYKILCSWSLRVVYFYFKVFFFKASIMVKFQRVF